MMTAAAANQLPIAIAGGGIAAAAMALALARCGREAVLIGDADDPSHTKGGMQLAPNGWAALDSLGISQELEPLASKLVSLRLMSLENALTLATIRLDRRRYTGMARSHLLGTLMAAAKTGITPIKSRIKSIESGTNGDTDGVTIKLGNGKTIKAAWLIGCDGAHGICREFVEAGGGRAPLHIRTALRAHIRAKKTGAIPVGGHSTTVWLDAASGGHVVHYPLHDGSINLVAVVRPDGPAHDNALTMLARQPLLAGFTDAIASARPTPLYDYAPLDTWQRGRIVLAGDAAHPMPPHLAQGAGQSLVDAASLMGHLSGYKNDDLQPVFTEWSAARVRALRGVMKSANRAGAVFGWHGMGARMRDIGLGSIGEAALGRVLNEIWQDSPMQNARP